MIYLSIAYATRREEMGLINRSSGEIRLKSGPSKNMDSHRVGERGVLSGNKLRKGFKVAADKQKTFRKKRKKSFFFELKTHFDIDFLFPKLIISNFEGKYDDGDLHSYPLPNFRATGISLNLTPNCLFLSICLFLPFFLILKHFDLCHFTTTTLK
jgi:hypothetical protein